MKIDTLVLGLYENNCYVLRTDEKHKDCLIIDTGLDGQPLIEFLQEHELVPEAILLTHGHVDHIAAIDELKRIWPKMKVCIHKDDAQMLSNPKTNMSALAGVSFKTRPADILLDDDATVLYAGISLDVLHTPGHTPGGACFYSSGSGVVFVGDTVFAGGVGRTDFPYGNGEQLIAGIKEKLLTLPETTRVYPGHGPATTLRNEKKHNPYLK
ncbi:MAG: MBL fold metallo-hydrolase [Sedimentisphaerales bacterium]|nr:MBL fold metallo-hydrolase [Sedimentisphaerales bacterium]